MNSEPDLRQLKQGFDVRRYLDDLGIGYRKAGEENVSEGWIGIDCVFCGDTVGHLGIHYERGNSFVCWMCHEGGDAITLIQELEGIGFNAARERREEYPGSVAEKRKREPKHYGSLLPEGFERIEAGNEPLPVRKWFGRRNFDLGLCQEHGLGWVRYGDYQLRLIIPVYLDGEVVSFQAADVTGRARIPYLDCPEDRAVVPNKHLLYGLDDVGDQVILVEGVTDKWRMGQDAVALFGKNWNMKQLCLLYDRCKGKKLKVLLDLDAMREGKRLCYALRDFFDDILFGVLKHVEDPAELGQEKVEGILRY